jgi:hypothetical protein
VQVQVWAQVPVLALGLVPVLALGLVPVPVLVPVLMKSQGKRLRHTLSFRCNLL